MIVAAIHSYGDTIHRMIERKNYRGLFMPGFVPKESRYKPGLTGLKYVDHCVGNVELGAMNKWVAFYEHVLGFTNILTFDDKTISTSTLSAVRSAPPQQRRVWRSFKSSI